MAGMGGEGGGGSLMEILFAFLLYAALNLFLNYFNKWALDPKLGDFHFPTFYSMWHMVASVGGSCVMMKIKPPKTGWPSLTQLQEYKWGLCGLAMFSTINIVCNNYSLMFVSVFVNQVIKATAPGVAMTSSFFIMGRRYALGLIAAVGLLCVSAIGAVPQGKSGEQSSLVGIVLVIIATLASATKPVIGELLMTSSTKPKLDPSVLVFYDCAMSFFFMLALWLLSGTFESFAPQYNEFKGAPAYIAAKPGTAVLIIIAGSFAAFSYNFTVYYFTKVANAVTVIVCTNLIKVVLITSSAIIMKLTDVFNWSCIVIFFGSVIAYAYLQYLEKQKKKAAPAPAPAPAKEQTKLLNP